MSKLLLQGGRIIDKAGDRYADVLIDSDGRIEQIGEGLEANKILDVRGKIISSGFVDLNAFIGEPGEEQSETFISGTRSAVKGGYTAIMTVPDSHVVNDNPNTAKALIELSKQGLCEVITAGESTLTGNRAAMSPLGEMSDLGVKFFTITGSPSTDLETTRRIMEYSQKYGIKLLFGSSKGLLSQDGVMNEGAVSSQLGILGIPKVAEQIEVFQLCQLALLTGADLHFQQISTSRSIQIIAEAKLEGASVTCEISPHHFSLDESLVRSFNARYKVFPPLRNSEEIELIKQQITSVDAIATGHRPHPDHLKDQAFADAPFGTIGFETSLGAAITNLQIPISEILNLLSWTPAEIAGIADTHGGNLLAGRPANLTVFDPDAAWTVEGKRMSSACSVTAFENMELKGLVSHTLVDGKLVVMDGTIQDIGK